MGFIVNRRNFLRFATGMGVGIGLNQLLPAHANSPAVSVPFLPTTDYPTSLDLQIQETVITLGGRNSKAYTINGSVPGPLLRWKEGQPVTINVHNHLNTDTSIHWHGIILPPDMDGVPGVSFAGIRSQSTFTYQFPVNQNGTYWYHSHSGLQEQQGHFGPIIIDPIDPEPFEYDLDYVVMLSDWTFEDPHAVLANLKRMPAYYNYQRRTIANFSEDGEWRAMRMDPTDIADVTGATYTYLMNGTDPATNWTALFQPGQKVRLRFINASAMTFFDVRIPGLKMTVVQADGQYVQPVTVDEFRIAVAETYDVIVEPDGSESAYTIFAETMDRSGYARGTLALQHGLEAPLPPRRERPLRTMADMGMDHGAEHGTSTPHAQTCPPDGNGLPHANPNSHGSHAGAGNTSPGSSAHSGSGHGSTSHAGASLSIPTPDMSGTPTPGGNAHDPTCAPTDALFPHGPDTHGIGNASVPMVVRSRLHEPGIGLENTGTRVLVYTDLKSLQPGDDLRQPDRELELHLTGNMERYMWSFDGKKYSEEKELTFYHGERLRLVFVNDTMMEHPMHLHGMWMDIDTGAGAYKPRKHTISIKPAERAAVEITVDAPGRWAFHCHLLYHMEVGMFRTVAVVDRPMEVQ